MKRLQLGVLASGRGSNFESILKAIQEERLFADVRVLISNRKSAGALTIASRYHIRALALSRSAFQSDEAFDQEILRVFQNEGVDFIALAGYLRLLTPVLVHQFPNRILNIHPALLPAFGGKGMYGHYVHEAVLAHGCKVSGVTVHLVNEQYDAGPIVLQRCVPVCEEDTPETLAARVLEEEHRAFPDALQLFAEERIFVEGQKVHVLEK